MPSAEPTEIAAGSPSSSPPPGEGVLIVDDYADACEAMRRLVTRAGYPSTCVLSGRDALTVLRQRPRALVLLDLMMPEMSGWDVLRAMKADPDLRAIPVIICSAAERETHWEELARLGADDFLIKADTKFIARLGAILHAYLGPPRDKPDRGGPGGSPFN